jgi:hypothetical protein
MKLIKPNSKDQTIDGISIFLAGSIEMGVAEDWQSKIVNTLKNKYVTILNPRRDDWDSSWVQEQSNPQFNHQVNWELNNLDRADIIFMYFAPDTKSPISLLELGKYVSTNMVVCCPKGFWRKGNVDIVCTRHDAPLFNDFDDAVGALLTKISNY